MTSAVDRIFDVLEALANAPDGLPLLVIATTTGMAKPTVHRLLADLEARALVCRVGDGGVYALTLELPVLANRFLISKGFIDLCQPELDRLAKISGELVRFAWRDGDRLVYVAEAQGAHEGLRYDSNLGRTVIMHATAIGKCLLAWLPAEIAARAVNKQGLLGSQTLGPNAITTMPALTTELARVRRRGFGTARDESEVGAAAVASPIFSDSNRTEVVAALAVIGPTARVSAADLTEMAVHVMKSAEELSRLVVLAPFSRKGDRDPRSRARAAERNP
jgi:IclR family transcriptional regulator, acetate operon repressor